jgi:hypothetical protein
MTLLDSDTSAADTGPIVAIGRLLWAGPLTVIASVAAVLLVRLLVIRIPGVRSDATPLGLIAPTIDTVILISIAVVVFVQFCAFSDDPVRRFRRVALGALLVSFIPLVVTGRGPMIGGLPTTLALAAMHVAAYVPCVTLMPVLVTIKK